MDGRARAHAHFFHGGGQGEVEAAEEHGLRFGGVFLGEGL